MIMLFIILVLLCIIIDILYILYLRKNYIKKNKIKLEEKINNDLRDANERVAQQQSQADRLVQSFTEAERNMEKSLEQQKELVNEKLKNHFIKERAWYVSDLDDEKESVLEEARDEYLQAVEHYKNEIRKYQDQLKDFQSKQQAVNDEILRRRAAIEQQDFYRICIPEDDKKDIEYLISIIPNIKNKQLLYKLIWSEYLQKPFKQMLQNVLGNTDPSNVIYMIKNLKTDEIYIGKTVGSVANRWTEHIKTSLGLGTITKAKIHEKLYQHWDEFSFSVLEKVDKDKKLGDQEKYWIDFYQSNTYGYNMKNGG